MTSSVEDVTIEQKFQHKKKLICVASTFLICIIVASTLFFVAHEATNGFDFPNSDTVTPDMVLPQTILTIEKVSDSQSKGTIQFEPHEMQFSWHSLFNKSHDFIKFSWDSDNFIKNEQSSDYYNEYLNGISGFMIDLQGDDISNSPSTRNTSSVATLGFYIYKFDSDTIDTITIRSGGDFEDEDEDLKDSLSTEEGELLNLMVNGYIGEYFSELSFKLGALKYVGDEYKSIKFIHNYAKFFYANAGENQASNRSNWNFTMLEEAIQLTNIIVMYNGSRSQQDETNDKEQTYEISDDGSARSLLVCGAYVTGQRVVTSISSACFF